MSAVTLMGVVRAKHKPFWVDEANELVATCGMSSGTMILSGAPSQCSPAPLYYLVEQAVVRGFHNVVDNPLVLTRLVSLGAAFLGLIFMFLVLSGQLGVAYGYLSLLFFFNQPIFHGYMAENRPYMLWLVLFLVALIWTARLSSHKTLFLDGLPFWFYGTLCVFLSAAAGGGFLQILGCLFCLNLFHWRIYTLRRVVILSAVSILVGLNYALRSCTNYDGGQWDFLATRNWNLIRDVSALLWPTGSPVGLAFDLLLLIGLAFPFVYWKERKLLGRRDRFVLCLSSVSGLQIFTAFFIGILVARAHYYFTPRLFIFLIAIRSCLVVCGTYSVLRFLEGIDTRHLRFTKSLVGLAVLIGLTVTIHKNYQSLEVFVTESNNVSITVNSLSCSILGPDMVVGLDNPNTVDLLNFYAVVKNKFGGCFSSSVPPGGFIVGHLAHDPNHFDFQVISDQPGAAGMELGSLCGLPLKLGRFE